MLKNTLNLSFFFFLFLLVKFNILLLNEESLILFCFVLFCFLSVNKLGNQASSYFQEQTLTIRSDFLNTTQKLLNVSMKKKKSLNRTQTWVNEFNNLHLHFTMFNKIIFKSWPKVYVTQINLKLHKKLLFTKRLEQQILKLISLVILDKIRQNLLNQQFCLHKLTVKKFQSLEKIYLREHLTKFI